MSAVRNSPGRASISSTSPMTSPSQPQQQLQETFLEDWCALYGIGEQATAWLRYEQVMTADDLLKFKVKDIMTTPFPIPYGQRCVLRGALLQFKADKSRVLTHIDNGKKPVLPPIGAKLNHSASPHDMLPAANQRKLSQSHDPTAPMKGGRSASGGLVPLTYRAGVNGGASSSDLVSMSSRSTSLGNISALSSDSSLPDIGQQPLPPIQTPRQGQGNLTSRKIRQGSNSSGGQGKPDAKRSPISSDT